MAQNKTTQTDASVDEFLANIEDEAKRTDAQKLNEIMSRLSGKPPKMWGASLIGFDQYHYKYDSGREGDFFRVGFSPRKANLTIYIVSGFDKQQEMLDRLGKHKIGKSCLYIKRLSDIDIDVLEEMINADLHHMAEKYG